VTGDRDPTRPEYVVSDMLRPLPELDLNFVSFDTAHEGACPAVQPPVSPTTDCDPDGPSRPSYAAVIHGQEGDAVGHILSSDDSLSSSNENSPGGLRKRHNASPFRRRVDKKLLQIPRGRGRGFRRGGSFSDTTVDRPVYSDGGSAVRHGHSDTALGQPVVCCGHGRGIVRGPTYDAVISRPAFEVLGRGCQLDSSPESPPLQPEFQSRPNATASWEDITRRCETQPIRSNSNLFRGLPDSAIIQMSSASSEDGPDRQFVPMYSAPREPAVNMQLPPAPDLSVSASSAASVGAATTDGGVSSQCRCSNVIRRRGSRLLPLFEPLDVDGADSFGDAPVDPDVELIKFEPPARCVVLC